MIRKNETREDEANRVSGHPYGWLSLLPPVAAIVLAIATRRVVPSLLGGIVAGALVTSGGDVPRAIADTLEIHLWKTLVDEGKLRVFAFTLLMGAMVGVINRSGGMRGLVLALTPLARDRRRGQLTTWLLGLLIFFDDYANTVLLGSTLRPLCDRLKISREKLAYLVDSTAAPVAGLALISTWVAVEIEYVQDGIDNVTRVAVAAAPLDREETAEVLESERRRATQPASLKAIDLFVGSIPYRFYVLWSLAFVPLIAITGRDFGPMLAAERRSARGQRPATAMRDISIRDPTGPDPQTPSRWWNAVLPIVCTVVAIVWLLYTTGQAAILASEPTANPTLRDVFGAAASSFSLLWGCFAGLIVAGLLVWGQRLLTFQQLLDAAGTGARMMLPALVILWLASTLSRMTGNKPVAGYESTTIAVGEQAAGSDRSGAEASEAAVEPAIGHPTGRSELAAAMPSFDLPYRLYTGEYMGSLLGRTIPAWSLPTLVFVLASVVALSTGTSYGTMGILLPIVIPLACGILLAERGTVDPNDPILLASVAGVLAGAIFGDHCSPISDTTVLSSQSSGCQHTAHVWTQMPYALAVAGTSIVLGTLPVGLGAPAWLLLPMGIVAMAIMLRVVGRHSEDCR
ncbi:MAG: Na+/H+ antiporter NhaC family protein [Pirellulales bacterium]